ncbi:MAG TPA: glutamate 5-kinase [Bacteroidaceae bacterium]|nr:glutamate 5-kinase [Bacteroidaceae bacterium]
MKYRTKLKNKNKIVVKIGTSLLTYDNSKINLIRMEKLARVLASLRNSGKDVVLVSSGAVGVGIGILGLDKRPDDLVKKQAMAAIGQVGLIRLYQKFFEEYNISVAQLLLTRDGLENAKRRRNARNTFHALLEMGIIPIVNENDTVSTEEIEFGDNDTLSAAVATLIHADLLIILTDTDGVYTADPHANEFARKVSKVKNASLDLKDVDLNGRSKMGSGGMVTKVAAAELCREHDVDVIIADGTDPLTIIDILEGKDLGTFFVSDVTIRQVV